MLLEKKVGTAIARVSEIGGILPRTVSPLVRKCVAFLLGVMTDGPAHNYWTCISYKQAKFCGLNGL